MTDAMPITRSLPVLVDTVGRAQLGHHPGPPRAAHRCTSVAAF